MLSIFLNPVLIWENQRTVRDVPSVGNHQTWCWTCNGAGKISYFLLFSQAMQAVQNPFIVFMPQTSGELQHVAMMVSNCYVIFTNTIILIQAKNAIPCLNPVALLQITRHGKLLPFSALWLSSQSVVTDTTLLSAPDFWQRSSAVLCRHGSRSQARGQAFHTVTLSDELN